MTKEAEIISLLVTRKQISYFFAFCEKYYLTLYTFHVKLSIKNLEQL